MVAALLDTSVLWPSLQRDFLLSLAAEGAYRPVWSSAILAELERHEALKLQDRGVPTSTARQQASGLVQQMRAAFADAEAVGWEPLEGTFNLPDPDDEHVAAAAVVAEAEVIVTANLRDFPAVALPPALQVLPAPDFALAVVSTDLAAASRAVRAIAARSGRFGLRWSAADVLDILATRYAMDQTVELLHDVV